MAVARYQIGGVLHSGPDHVDVAARLSRVASEAFQRTRDLPLALAEFKLFDVRFRLLGQYRSTDGDGYLANVLSAEVIFE